MRHFLTAETVFFFFLFFFFFVITALANSTWSAIPFVETLVCDALVRGRGTT
jgi:hypothetical protein